MKKKLIEYIAEFFMNTFSWTIYKNFLENMEIDREYFYAQMDQPLLLMVPPGIDRDMLDVQIKEAQEEGYIKDYEIDNEVISAAGALVFDITDKGREFLVPYIKDKLKEHYTELLVKIDSI